jgi:hypothetical protein
MAGFSSIPIPIILVTRSGCRKRKRKTMIPVKITDEMFLNARKKNREMGLLRNSIIKGNGSIAGFLGEQIVLEVLGGEWVNTYEYDIVLSNGLKVEVKTKQTTVTPKPDYSCSISNFNTRQQCDIYAFTRVMKDYSVGWYLGCCTPAEYFDKASFVKKNDYDPSNNWTSHADCYNLPIQELKDVQDYGPSMLNEHGRHVHKV